MLIHLLLTASWMEAVFKKQKTPNLSGLSFDNHVKFGVNPLTEYSTLIL